MNGSNNYEKVVLYLLYLGNKRNTQIKSLVSARIIYVFISFLILRRHETAVSIQAFYWGFEQRVSHGEVYKCFLDKYSLKNKMPLLVFENKTMKI